MIASSSRWLDGRVVVDVRVLHVLPTRAGEYGGPVRVAEALCAQVIREGHDAEIFPPPEPPDRPARLAYWPGTRTLSALPARVRGADLVHVHGLWTIPTSTAALCARAASRPFIITPHGMLDRWSLGHNPLRKKLYATLIERGNLDAAAALHFFNEGERQEAADFGIRAPTFLLPNGVDVAQFDALPGSEALWLRYPATRHKKVVLFLGRLHPKKGLPLLIEALAEIAARRQDVHLVIAGPDEAGHLAEVEALVSGRRLEQHVTFTGPVVGEEKRLLLGAADVFVLPSHQEGDSVAVKEALAAGLPVVITHACHFPQVSEEEAGLVVSPVTDEIEGALERLCSDDSLRTRMAENARRLVERDYRWERLGAQLVDRYQEVLARHRAGALS